MKIDGNTRMAAVVANPIKHSLSPFIHNLAFDLTDENGVYLAWEIEETGLEQTLSNVLLLDMYGLNISMPYKQKTAELVDYLTDEARLTNAVNTVINFDGKLIGHNTDGIGFFKNLLKHDFEVRNQEITVIGGGGAAIAIIAQTGLLGAAKINVFVRRSNSYEPLSERLSQLSNATECPIEIFELSNLTDLQNALSNSALLVNCTPVGMSDDKMPFDESVTIDKNLLVVDTIYKNPETQLLKWAKNQGATTENGLGMLLYQAAESYQMWTGKKMPVDEIEKELKNEINR